MGPEGIAVSGSTELTRLALAAKADPKKIPELLDRWAPAMWSLIARYTGPYRLPDHARDDAAQEVRIAIIKALATYDEKRGSFSRWANWATQDALSATISQTELVRTVKGFKRVEALKGAHERQTARGDAFLAALATPLPEEDAHGLADPSPTPAESCDSADRAEAVLAAINRIPSKACRTAVRCFLRGEASPGVSKQAHHEALHRAFRVLRVSLASLVA